MQNEQKLNESLIHIHFSLIGIIWRGYFRQFVRIVCILASTDNDADDAAAVTDEEGAMYKYNVNKGRLAYLRRVQFMLSRRKKFDNLTIYYNNN